MDDFSIRVRSLGRPCGHHAVRECAPRTFNVKRLCVTSWLVGAFWARADQQKNSFYPASFVSREAAEESAHHLFAGGDVDVLHVGNKDFPIYIVHGSGLPDIGIAAYFWKNGAWRFAKAIWPSPSEFIS